MLKKKKYLVMDSLLLFVPALLDRRMEHIRSLPRKTIHMCHRRNIFDVMVNFG